MSPIYIVVFFLMFIVCGCQPKTTTKSLRAQNIGKIAAYIEEKGLMEGNEIDLPAKLLKLGNKHELQELFWPQWTRNRLGSPGTNWPETVEDLENGKCYSFAPATDPFGDIVILEQLDLLKEAPDLRFGLGQNGQNVWFILDGKGDWMKWVP